MLGLDARAAAILAQTVVQAKNDDEVRRSLQKLLVPIRSEWGQDLLPLIRHAMLVGLFLFFFGRLAYPLLDVRIRDHDEAPGLLVRTGRRGTGRTDRRLDELVRHRLRRKAPHRPTPIHERIEILGAPRLLVRFKSLELQRNELIFLFHFSFCPKTVSIRETTSGRGPLHSISNR